MCGGVSDIHSLINLRIVGSLMFIAIVTRMSIIHSAYEYSWEVRLLIFMRIDTTCVCFVCWCVLLPDSPGIERRIWSSFNI